MIARVCARRPFAACALLAALAGCSHARAPEPPRNADERLADDVMVAILHHDMRPEVDRFVAERRSALLDPVQVGAMHDLAAGGGEFLGAREVPQAGDARSTMRVFDAAFSKGDLALTILFDDSGKIVHYHLGGVVSAK